MPKTPNWLQYKICMIGYPFAGKKTQADLIKAKYGLDVFDMGTMVQEAIDFAEQNPHPLHRDVTPQEEIKVASELTSTLGNGGVSGALRKEDSKAETEDALSVDVSEDEDGDYNAKEDFRQAGLEMKEMLLEGMEICDELYVKMFIAKLRLTYEYKDPNKKQRELKEQASRKMKINNRLADIEKELAEDSIKPKSMKTLTTEKEKLCEERDSMDIEKDCGWILLDFPSSYAQAKLLEEALSGYKPDPELIPVQRDIEMEEAFLLVQPHAKEEPPKCMIKSGLDAVLWFNCE